MLLLGYFVKRQLSCIDVVCVSQVRDSKHKCSLGSVRLAVASLLKEADMALNQQFPLQNSGPNSTLKLKMALRVGVSVYY